MPEPSADDDELAARLRAAVDGGAAPVTIDEARSFREVMRAPRSSVPFLAIAAAFVALLVIAVVAVVRSGPEPFTATIPPATGAPITIPVGSVPPAAGGIYESNGDVLRGKLVNAMAVSGSLVYVGYQGDGTDPGLFGGVVVADVDDGRVWADHPLPGSVNDDAMAADGLRVWIATTNERDVAGTALWAIDKTHPPVLIDRLDRSSRVSVGDDGVWVHAQGELQHRAPATGELIESANGNGFGWTVDGPGPGNVWRVQENNTLVQLDGVQPGRQFPFDLADGRITMLEVIGDRVFVARGATVLEIDGATGSIVAEHRSGGVTDVAALDIVGGRVAALGVADRSSAGAGTIGMVNLFGDTGMNGGWAAGEVGRSPKLAAAPDGSVIVCGVRGPDDRAESCRRSHVLVGGRASAGDPSVPEPSPSPVPDGSVFGPVSPQVQGRTLRGIETDGAYLYVGYSELSGNSGVLVAELDSGRIVADHQPEGFRLGAQNLVAAGGKVWMAPFVMVAGSELAPELWSITGADAPVSVAPLDRWYSLGADGDDLVLQAENKMQRRRGADGSLIEEGAWVGAGWPSDGYSTIESASELVTREGIRVTDGVALGRNADGVAIDYLRASGNSVFVARGSEVLEVGGAANTTKLSGPITAMDRAGSVVWAAASKPWEREGPRFVELVAIDAPTGAVHRWQGGEAVDAQVAALEGGEAIVCGQPPVDLETDPPEALVIVCERATSPFVPSH